MLPLTPVTLILLAAGRKPGKASRWGSPWPTSPARRGNRVWKIVEIHKNTVPPTTRTFTPKTHNQ